ncbi:MAG: HlyD family secretion protein [Algoriphagus sp.]|nr:HlyD family secretion protein [Algoriphagus sp.]
MLNISKNRIKDLLPFSDAKSLVLSHPQQLGYKRVKILAWVIAFFFLLLFLPWTQNIRSKGYVTALRPDQRPQTIHSIIPGRIERWYVAEGDYVQAGDTILRISEVKDEYFDSLLLPRTQQQVDAKALSAESYGEKVIALQSQISALEKNNVLKIQQAKNYLENTRFKVQSDSISFVQAKVNYDIGKYQLDRAEQLSKEGLISVTSLEGRRLKFQEVQANLIAAENKWMSSKNEFITAKIDLNAIDNEYKDKVAKAKSEMFTAMSSQFDAEATVTKLENQYSNYQQRSQYRYILAPQNGFIAKAIQVGIGETIKEGAEIVNIVPANAALAVEMFVQPVDLPLINLFNDVPVWYELWRQLNGFPADYYTQEEKDKTATSDK